MSPARRAWRRWPPACSTTWATPSTASTSPPASSPTGSASSASPGWPGPPSSCASTPRTCPPSSPGIPGASSSRPTSSPCRTSCVEERDALLKEMQSLSRERRAHQVHRQHAAEARALRGRGGAGGRARSSSTRPCACTPSPSSGWASASSATTPTCRLIFVDRHKLLQILLNLLSNARHALMDSAQEDKRLTIRVQPLAGRRAAAHRGDGQRRGHRRGEPGAPVHAGLHHQEDGPRLRPAHQRPGRQGDERAGSPATSPGPGQGATFTLELPMKSESA